MNAMWHEPARRCCTRPVGTQHVAREREAAGHARLEIAVLQIPRVMLLLAGAGMPGGSTAASSNLSGRRALRSL